MMRQTVLDDSGLISTVTTFAFYGLVLCMILFSYSSVFVHSECFDPLHHTVPVSGNYLARTTMIL